MQSVLRHAAALLLGLCLAGTAPAQERAPDREYQPVIGQEGKDVIWVPTPEALVERMLKMAKTTPEDYVIDLGSGDGRTVIAAAKKFGARALGIEYNADMVALSRRNAEKEGVADRARFIQGDIFRTDFSQATVLTLYLLPNLNLKLRPTILDMKPGTRVVSHAFTMGEWQPDEIATVEGRTAYLWIVPAKVEGIWRWGGARTFELVLRQHFQLIEGLASVDGRMAQFRHGRLDGDKISFSVVELTNTGTRQRDFVGQVKNNTIEGVVKLPGGGEEKWIATRVK